MRTIFLDRDGVINENRPDYVKAWSEFRFLPRAVAALRRLTRHGFQIFVVTNQACVNRGLVGQAMIEEIHRRMVRCARDAGAMISEVRYCPHRSDEGCGCRKPQPGMLLALAHERRLDLSGAYLVGDAMSDIAAGAAAGCRTALVLTGLGSQQRARPVTGGLQPSVIVGDLWDAVQWVLEQEGWLELPSSEARLSRPGAKPRSLVRGVPRAHGGDTGRHCVRLTRPASRKEARDAELA